MSNYGDILHRSRPVSAKHVRMSLLDRAAQFSSFAALTGYEDVIEETGRLTEAQVQLDESVIASIDQQLQALLERIKSNPSVSITYFHPDAHKTGGSYLTKAGRLKEIDPIYQRLIFTDRTEIPLAQITAISENQDF